MTALGDGCFFRYIAANQCQHSTIAFGSVPNAGRKTLRLRSSVAIGLKATPTQNCAAWRSRSGAGSESEICKLGLVARFLQTTTRDGWQRISGSSPQVM